MKILTIFYAINVVVGCDCAPATAKEYFDFAEVVFTGKISQLKDVTTVNSYGFATKLQVVTVRVDKVYKGSLPVEITTLGSYGVGDCRFNWKKSDRGKKILFFAGKLGRKIGGYNIDLNVNQCGGTKFVSNNDHLRTLLPKQFQSQLQ